MSTVATKTATPAKNVSKPAAAASTAPVTSNAPAAAEKPADAAAPVAPVVKISAGDAAIAAAQKAGCSNAQTLKAVWSTRGNIYAPVAGFSGGIAIVKSDLTKHLQSLKAADLATFQLVPRAGAEGGADLVTPAPAAKK